MLQFLALLTNKRSWRLYSRLIALVLRCHGVRVGSGLYIEGTPKLKIRGKGENIVIGDNVQILGDIDLRNRENGRIMFHDGVVIEGGCRFVSAREGVIEIGQGSIVTTGALINGGANIRVGRNTIIGPRASINANDHKFDRATPMRQQGFIHEDVTIGDDCWLAANVVVMKGVTIAEGSVIGAGAVVTKDTEPYSINVGIPARKIAERP